MHERLYFLVDWLFADQRKLFFPSSACNMKRFCKMSESVIRNLKIKFSARLDCRFAFKASAIDSSVVTKQDISKLKMH